MAKLSSIQIIFIIFLCITFIFGLYFTMYFDYCDPTKIENMEIKRPTADSCPDLLVKNGNILLLYDTKKETSETNPIPFFNLDEYINYLEIQRENGINCPVLFVQQENNAQGKNVYKIRPGPFDLQGGLPEEIQEQPLYPQLHIDSNRSSNIYNKNNYPGFDPYSQEVGIYTDIDAVHYSTGSKKISDNPMDTNWAGNTYTQQMVDSGKYIENEITRPHVFSPKTVFYPSIPSASAPPKDFL